MVASLFQPEVWRYEVAPWPERAFGGRYPRRAADRERMPPEYATELQTVMNALNDMQQERVVWDCGTTGIGVLVSDSLMFERGEPEPSELHLSHVYGLALPLLKRGMPVTPVQLENILLPDYLSGFRLLLLSYQGMKPLTPAVHDALTIWVRNGGVLIVCDDDRDPFNHVREWWNTNGLHYATPREHLFETLKLNLDAGATNLVAIGKGGLLWIRENPVNFALSAEKEPQLVARVKQGADRAGLKWRETNYLLLRRGPYVIAAGLDESTGITTNVLHGRFVNLFDSALRVQTSVALAPGSRVFLLDLDSTPGTGPRVLASACKALPVKQADDALSLATRGVGGTPALLLLRASVAPRSITIDGEIWKDFTYSPEERLLWIRSRNETNPRNVSVDF
jgi:hypothetical protein